MSLGSLDQLDEAHKELADLRKSLGRVMSERDLWLSVSLAAAEYIALTPCDHDVNKTQHAAWKKYRALVERADALLLPLPGPDYSDC